MTLKLIFPGRHSQSYGGFLTSKLIEANASVFSLGMAVAPVTDWHLYDSLYTERYMGLPEQNGGGYRNASVREMDGFRHADFALAHGCVLSFEEGMAPRADEAAVLPAPATTMFTSRTRRFYLTASRWRKSGRSFPSLNICSQEVRFTDGAESAGISASACSPTLITRSRRGAPTENSFAGSKVS